MPFGAFKFNMMKNIETTEEAKLAKEIFNRHYIDQLDKNLYPHNKAVELSIKEAEKKGLTAVKKYIIENF